MDQNKTGHKQIFYQLKYLNVCCNMDDILATFSRTKHTFSKFVSRLVSGLLSF